MCIPPVDDLKHADSDAATHDGDGAIDVDGDAGDAGHCAPLAPDAEVSYELAALGSDSVTIDGDCSDAAWSRAGLLPFAGLVESGSPPVWRMLWSAKSGTVFGCVEIQDPSYEAHVLQNDQPMWATDDRLELWLDAEPVGEDTIKVTFNRAGHYHDANHPYGASNANTAFETVLAVHAKELPADDGGEAGTPDSGAKPDAKPAAVGWTVEWEVRPALAPAAGHVGRCEFAKFDVSGGAQSGDIAFGPLINGFATFGYCRYGCGPTVESGHD
ncbi:MAG: hypothetical protein U0263_33835 [Polyangiaceae bacterium]